MDSVDDTASGAGSPDEAQRRDARDSLFLLARIRPEGRGDPEKVRVRNVSSGGLMAETQEAFAVGDRIELALDGVGMVAGSVAWAEAGRIGVAFDHPIDKNLARKPTRDGQTETDLFRPMPSDSRRPPLKAR